MGSKVKIIYILREPSYNCVVMCLFKVRVFLWMNVLQLEMIMSPALAAQTKRNNSS